MTCFFSQRPLNSYKPELKESNNNIALAYWSYWFKFGEYYTGKTSQDAQGEKGDTGEAGLDGCFYTPMEDGYWYVTDPNTGETIMTD